MKITAKELNRASSDGYVIVSRPDRVNGGYHVMAVRVADETIIGWPRHVLDKSDISDTVTSINRDLDKFLGKGGKMSSQGRLRKGRKQYKLLSESIED
jgi:hypothetical protein